MGNIPEQLLEPISYIYYKTNITIANESPSFASEFSFFTNYSSAFDSSNNIPSRLWRTVEEYKSKHRELIEKYNNELNV